MANQTVYPYGTNGSLPSSVGIINDLTTGGADKALSAEQGVVIRDLITTPIDKTIGSWSKAKSNEYCTIETTDNLITITKVGSITMNRVGYSLSHLTDGSQYEITFKITCPSGADLYLFTYDTTLTNNTNRVYTNVVIPQGSTLQEIKFYITKSDITDYIGFTVESALANGSKIYIYDWKIQEYIPVKDNISTLYNKVNTIGIPIGYSKQEYSGERIRAANTVAIEPLLSLENTSAIQAMACYGEYAFQSILGGQYIDIYNLQTKSFVQRVEIVDGVYNTAYNHCNTAYFSNEKVDSADSFPLMYVCSGYAINSMPRCFGYRIQKTTTNGNETFTITRVHTISFEVNKWAEMVYADRYMFIRYNNGNGDVWARVRTPLYSDGDVTIGESDIISSVNYDDYLHADGISTQGYFYYNGRIFSVWGVTSPFYLGSIDPNTGAIVSIVNLTDLGVSEEVESPFIYDGHICINSVRKIYRLYFD